MDASKTLDAHFLDQGGLGPGGTDLMEEDRGGGRSKRYRTRGHPPHL